MFSVKNYNINSEDFEFLNDIIFNLKENQMSINLKFNNFLFQIDPCGNFYEVWNKGVLIEKYSSLDDLFLNFKLDNKPFIERISEIEYE